LKIGKMNEKKKEIGRRNFIFQSLIYTATVRKKAKVILSTPPKRIINKLCINANNGKVIFEERAEQKSPPASLVKLMLMYLVALKVNRKEIKLEDDIHVKRTIYPKNNSDILLSPDRKYKLGYLMDAIAIISSNTSAVAVAEYLWGSEKKCVEDMNLMASKLGMKDTEYFTVNGYPVKSGNDLDRTTARDLSLIALNCCKLPVLLSWTSKQKFIIQEESIERNNTNDLLSEYVGCDGLKTGYTRLAGHCIVATAKRANLRIIAVVMGAEKSSERFRVATNLLEMGFAETI